MDMALDYKMSTASASQVWDACLRIIRNDVTVSTFETWFVPIKPVELQENRIKIELPSRFFYEWIDQKHRLLLNRAIKQTLGDEGKLEYTFIDEQPEQRLEKPIDIRIRVPETKFQPKISDFVSNLNAKYTFSNFIKGSGNELAHAAGLAVGNTPIGSSFNPLFIYGGVGLGKTHLLHAIGNLSLIHI